MEKSVPIMNRTVLMTDTDNYSVVELNPYSAKENQPDLHKAQKEHESIKTALRASGVTVVERPSPPDCQDGVYVANWAFCTGDSVGDIAVASRLPNVRQGEQDYARQVLKDLGKTVLVPKWQRYSGQGDTLVCGDRLFLGSQYRTDKEMKLMLENTFKFKREQPYDIVPVQTVPRIKKGRPMLNKLSMWPESYFYDIDLAIGVVQPDLIAWCPDAFTPESQETIRNVQGLRKIEVDMREAMDEAACNFISTGETVIMSKGSPKLRLDLAKHGLSTVALDIPELKKGGGSVRCVALTLDNE